MLLYNPCIANISVFHSSDFLKHLRILKVFFLSFLISPYMTSFTGNYNKMKNGLDGSDADNIAKEKKR